MKTKWNILVAVLVIAGLMVLFYPVVSNWLAARNHTRVIEDYQITAEALSEQDKAGQFARAEAYNRRVNGSTIIDPFAPVESEEDRAEYLSILNLEGVMGYVRIPAIDVRLPIYHTTSDEVLKKGVGHMESSSFPIGGEGSHAVLTAHRGLPSSKLFTDLNKMELEDHFYIYVLDRVLVYEVDQILVVEPEDTEALRMVPGEEYVTLVTCTPYAINSHRLLVRGVRVDENTAEEPVIVKRAIYGRLLWLLILLGAIVVIIILINKRKNKTID